MPIRINFLAEHQAQQEERRRDPIKRATYGAALFVLLLAAWGFYLQGKVVAARMSVTSYQTRFKGIEDQYTQALANEQAMLDATRRLDSLAQLSSTRMLWGNGLNALQFAVLDQVDLGVLRTSQNFDLNPGVAPQTNSAGVITSAGVPPVTTEQVQIRLEARDNSPIAGDMISSYQGLIAQQPFFKEHLGEIKLEARSTPQQDLDRDGETYVSFILRCVFSKREHR